MGRVLHRMLLAWVLVGGVSGCGSDEKPKTTGAAQSPAERLGLNEADAGRESIAPVIDGSGYALIGPIVTAFKALPRDERGDMVWALALCMKTYYQSDAFADEYAKLRAERMPQPTVYDKTVEAEVEQALADQRRQLEETRVAMAQLPAESRDQMEQSYAEYTKMLENPEMRAMQIQSVQAQRTQNQADYEQSMQSWRDRYPENPTPIIARRLTEFLAMTDGIDFDAELVEVEGRKKFVNPAYESKSADWKWSFRTGEASVEAARKVATMWLAEIK